MRKILVLISCILISGSVSSKLSVTNKYTISAYIEEFKVTAICEMNRVGIPASITLAQAIIESGYGNSSLAIYANNHFGIKNKPDWNGELYNAGSICYKKYGSALESYVDHSNHIKSRKWYASLFNLKINDYKGWAHGLKKAGYAEDIYYAYRLIKIIEMFKLYDFDKEYSPLFSITAK